MERLNYDVLKKSGYDGYVLKDAPEKVLQMRRLDGTESVVWYSRLLRDWQR